jgi:hypothetical protein
VLVGVLALGLWLRGAFGRLVRRRRAGARARRAIAGENRSEVLLRRQGYTIVERQPRRQVVLLVDEEPHPVDVRADWLVERDGRRFVADTKTGRLAPSIDHAPTRRQLLEYRLVYDVVGVLLIDAEANEVHAVTFPGLPGAPPPNAFVRPLLALLTLAVLVVGWARWHGGKEADHAPTEPSARAARAPTSR